MCRDRKTNELLKWLYATGIYYPEQLPAEETANTITGHQSSQCGLILHRQTSVGVVSQPDDTGQKLLIV